MTTGLAILSCGYVADIPGCALKLANKLVNADYKGRLEIDAAFIQRRGAMTFQYVREDPSAPCLDQMTHTFF